jgi:hypothetical protein
MSAESSYDQLLQDVLDRVIQNNQQVRPGTPMAELKEAIEGALTSLPALEFEEFSQALENQNAAEDLIRQAPEIIGWNADQIVQWIEELSQKLR